MKKINIRWASPLILTLTSLFLFDSCVSRRVTYQNRVSECFKAADKEEFTIEGSNEKWIGINGNAEPNCILGVPLPDFETTDMGKNRIRTKDLKGKINVINFWFIRCAPCVAEIPDLNTLVKKYKSKDINFLAVSRDSSSAIVNFLKKHPFDFTIIPNGNDIFRKNFQLMWGYPFTIITNKKNVIIGAIQSKKSGSVINKIDSILVSQGL